MAPATRRMRLWRRLGIVALPGVALIGIQYGPAVLQEASHRA
ncbi:hypothetical protein BMS3Abin02_02468 [bacterium BMS3Abin02]|nr:hypothetical protein BMS3Abin02_02468 [bacterium BMS3Abin02]GBE23632.1 hypothetical protein BMS3Bbin01_03017 [bacterium BMS3Bbin01]